MPKKRKATDCRTRAAVARGISVKQSYPDRAPASTLQMLITGLFILAESPYLDINDRALAWSWFDRSLRQYVEVRHGL